MLIPNNDQLTIVKSNNRCGTASGTRAPEWIVGKATACATCKWKSSRPSALPVIFKAAVEMTAAQSENSRTLQIV